MAEHKEFLEKEASERAVQIERKEIKQKSRQLYNESKRYLEANEKDWEKRRLENEIETKRIERLAIGKEKQEKIRTKVRERNLEKEINENMEKLPQSEKRRIEAEGKISAPRIVQL